MVLVIAIVGVVFTALVFPPSSRPALCETVLHEVHPELTTFKAFQDLGHVQFTLGANEEIIEHFSQILAQSRRPDRREKRS